MIHFLGFPENSKVFYKGQNNWKAVSVQKFNFRNQDIVQLVEWVPSMQEILGSLPSTVETGCGGTGYFSSACL